MSTPLWVVEVIKRIFPYRNTTARLTRLPIVGMIFERALFEGDRLVFIPMKEVLIGEEISAEPRQLVLPYQAVEHFIQRANFLWVMDRCICRDAMKCRNYPVDLGCLFLGDAAKRINPRLGRPVTRDDALAHLEKCREAGLVHLVGRNKLDTVWLNVRPGERLLTVCNCCECCCLWRILPDVSDRISSKVTRMPGVKVEVTNDCTGCGSCAEGVCFAGAISVVGGAAVIEDSCRGCGRCARVCPQGAIRVSVDVDMCVSETVRMIESVVDVR